MSAGTGRTGYTIEPLDTERHDRSSFSCGIAQVDNYFRKTANKLAKAGNVRIYVLVGSTGQVAGFYAVNAHGVRFETLPAGFARTRPAHSFIPAAYISMIARDVCFRGTGCGEILLADTLRRITRASGALGIAVIMLDVLDCGDPQRVAGRLALYESFGFQSLASDRLRMYLPVATVRRLIEAEGD